MTNFDRLIAHIESTHQFFATKASTTINQFLTLRNWLIGFYIVEFEQDGENKAQYGDRLIESLAAKLPRIKGINKRSLFRFRQFYLLYPHISEVILSEKYVENQEIKKVGSLTTQLESTKKMGSAIPQLRVDLLTDPQKLITTLSYTHIEQLLSIHDPLKRAYYEIECLKGVWSVRELKRQIASLSYERSAAAENPQVLSAKLGTEAEQLKPDQLIKSPYVFDFLDLPDGILGSESKLEEALIADLKNFILELGHGFCFEAQQKRIVIGGEYFFIDLVFYHRILKCHVLIELKVDEFNHANAGQLNTYLQYIKANVQEQDDNPRVGILLCTNQNEELVQYALGGMDENLFVSQYQTVLPSTEELEAFLKAEKKKL
ncbi:MAG: PDDEXK nuclease domain-containing protein [Bacteroidota bacterium]